MKSTAFIHRLSLVSLLLVSLLLSGCANTDTPDNTDDSATAVRSEGYEFDVLDAGQYETILVEEAGVPQDLAQCIATEHFAKWDIDTSQPAGSGAYQLVRYVRYTHPDDLTQYGVCSGFIAVMTTGDSPVFEEVTYRYTAVPATDVSYTFELGASSAVMTSDTTVAVNTNGNIVTSSDGKIQRHEVEWYETVDLDEMQPK